MAALEQVVKTASDLWRDYAFLTSELVKFVSKQEYDMVVELLSQRDKLQVMIEAAPDDGYTKTQSGQELLQSVKDQNQTITTGLQRLYNNTKRSRQVSNAYEQSLGFTSSAFMDRQS